MQQLVGTIDAYHDGQLIGWAWDPNDHTRRLTIDVFVDGEFETKIAADALRIDLADAGIGNGSYAFFLKIYDVATDNATMVDLRFSETGESLAHSPFNLVETYWAHRTSLRNLLDSGPFVVRDFNFNGQYFEVSGFYHPLHGDLSKIRFEANGAPPVEVAWTPPDEIARREFWFLEPKSGGFRLRFASAAIGVATRFDIVQIKLIDPIAPLDVMRSYYIPTSIIDYQNVPDLRRQRRVMGRPNDARFVFTGRTHYETNRSLAQLFGLPAAQIKRVLDLGVGCGRIARHFLTDYRHIELHGIDIDADNVAWCVEHLPSGHFRAGPLVPPLPYCDQSFDFLYANSVFTHLTEEMQNLWLAEIARILNSSGLAVITFHGETAAAYARMPLDWLDRWFKIGIDSIGLNEDLFGFIADEKYYRNTYHTTAYIRAHWPRYVSILGFRKHVFGYQDAVVVRRHIATN